MGGISEGLINKLIPASVDDAQEIGALPVRTRVTAMRVCRDSSTDGQLLYEGEIPILVSKVWRIVEYKNGPDHRWWRLEIKATPTKCEVRPGDSVVVAEHPYANGWVHCAVFKPPPKGPVEDRPDVRDQEFSSLAELIAWIDGNKDLKHDFWESGHYLTAGISTPDNFVCPGAELRNVQQRALLVFGTCKDFDACVDDLWHAERVQRLRRLTEHNKIHFWFKKKTGLALPKLHEEVIAQREELILLSIRQALAGPHRFSDRWIRRPVVLKVDQIYRGHLNARNRVVVSRVARSHGRPGEFSDER